MTDPIPDRPKPTHIIYLTRAEFDRVIARAEELAGERFGRYVEGLAVDAIFIALRELLKLELPDAVFGFEIVSELPHVRLREVN